MWRLVSLKPMPWSHFIKGAFLGSSRVAFGLFWPIHTGPLGTRSGAVHFFNPRWPRVTINSNLKVTRAPAMNIPRIKPVNWPVRCPAGARWPLSGSARETRTIFEGQHAGYPPVPPPPYGTLAGS